MKCNLCIEGQCNESLGFHNGTYFKFKLTARNIKREG